VPQTFVNKAARHVAFLAGKPITIAAAAVSIALWVAAGPFAGYSEAWQLTINTATTIITFLMVFIIQNSQNRDSIAVQIKLNELLRSQANAKNILFDLEELSEEELLHIQRQYEALAVAARDKARRTHRDGGRPRIRIDIAN
jgi:low affinity Fe/Cu permease